jgi:phage shock protein E
VKDTFWIDVRTPGEFESGHLPEATNIPLQVLGQEFQARVPRKDAVVALYCRSGNRSGQALRLVQDMGYTRAFNAGGFQALSSERK